MKSRVIITFALFGVFLLSHMAYDNFKGPIDANFVKMQLEDDAVAYGMAKAATSRMINNSINITFAALMLIVWFSPMRRYLERMNAK